MIYITIFYHWYFNILLNFSLILISDSLEPYASQTELAMNIVRQKTSAEYSTRKKIQLIRGGKEYFNLLLHLINKATDSIHLQTYIYDEDETGLLVANALKAAGFTKLLTLFNKLPLLKCIAGKRTEIPATFAVIIIYKVKISIILLSVFINAKNYNNIFLQLLLEGLAA